MTKHRITVEEVETGRVILHVNGISLDVMADEDGLVAQLFKGGEPQDELAYDWK